MREGLKGLLKGGHRLAERGAVEGPGASLLAVGHGLIPHLAPQGMVRQPLDLLGHPLGRQRLESFDNAGMQRPAPLLQETSVGHLMREGVLKRIFALGEQPGLIEKLGGL